MHRRSRGSGNKSDVKGQPSCFIHGRIAEVCDDELFSTVDPSAPLRLWVSSRASWPPFSILRRSWLKARACEMIIFAWSDGSLVLVSPYSEWLPCHWSLPFIYTFYVRATMHTAHVPVDSFVSWASSFRTAVYVVLSRGSNFKEDWLVQTWLRSIFYLLRRKDRTAVACVDCKACSPSIGTRLECSAARSSETHSSRWSF